MLPAMFAYLLASLFSCMTIIVCFFSSLPLAHPQICDAAQFPLDGQTGRTLHCHLRLCLVRDRCHPGRPVEYCHSWFLCGMINPMPRSAIPEAGAYWCTWVPRGINYPLFTFFYGLRWDNAGSNLRALFFVSASCPSVCQVKARSWLQYIPFMVIIL